MKDLERCDMDEMDYYLGRCIKNWVAEHHPPAGGRGRLLRAAISPPVQRERQLARFLTYVKVYIIGSHGTCTENEFYFRPITQTRNWSYYFVTASRLAY